MTHSVTRAGKEKFYQLASKVRGINIFNPRSTNEGVDHAEEGPGEENASVGPDDCYTRCQWLSILCIKY